MARGNRQGAVVHRVGELLRVDPDAVGALQHHHLGVGAHLPLVEEGGEVQLGRDDPVAPRPVQTARDRRQAGRGRGHERDRAGRGGEQRLDVPAQLAQRAPPVLVPRRRAHFVPPGHEVPKPVLRPVRERPQRARIEVVAAPEDRELVADAVDVHAGRGRGSKASRRDKAGCTLKPSNMTSRQFTSRKRMRTTYRAAGLVVGDRRHRAATEHRRRRVGERDGGAHLTQVAALCVEHLPQAPPLPGIWIPRPDGAVGGHPQDAQDGLVPWQRARRQSPFGCQAVPGTALQARSRAPQLDGQRRVARVGHLVEDEPVRVAVPDAAVGAHGPQRSPVGGDRIEVGLPIGQMDGVGRSQGEVVEHAVLHDAAGPRRRVPLRLVDEPQRVGLGPPDPRQTPRLPLVRRGRKHRPRRVKGRDSPRADVHGEQRSRVMPDDAPQSLELSCVLSGPPNAPHEASGGIEHPDVLTCPVRNVGPARSIDRQADNVARRRPGLCGGPAWRLPHPKFLDENEVRFRPRAHEIAVVHAHRAVGEGVDPHVVVAPERIARGTAREYDDPGHSRRSAHGTSASDPRKAGSPT